MIRIVNREIEPGHDLTIYAAEQGGFIPGLCVFAHKNAIKAVRYWWFLKQTVEVSLWGPDAATSRFLEQWHIGFYIKSKNGQYKPANRAD